MFKELKEKFIAFFGDSDYAVHSFFAPGRACILGEHLDYNSGLVLPYSLSLGTYLLVRKRNDRLLRAHSLNADAVLEISMDSIHKGMSHEWWNYPLGVIEELQTLTVLTNGFDLMFYGDLPMNAGLSSSASIGVVTAYAISELAGIKLPLTEIAQLCRQAENNFAGVQCGIMDQYAGCFGKKDHAILLNCLNLHHEYIPVNLQDFMFMIVNSNKPRQLEKSAFNDRFNECERSREIIRRLLPVNYLPEVKPAQFDSIAEWFPDEISYCRAFHIINENHRLIKACEALRNDDINSLSRIMNQSHESSRDYFQISCFEIEVLVKAARKIPGCIASRISGGGFGGCIVSLLRNEAVHNFREQVESEYKATTGLIPAFYTVSIDDGVRHIGPL